MMTTSESPRVVEEPRDDSTQDKSVPEVVPKVDEAKTDDGGDAPSVPNEELDHEAELKRLCSKYEITPILYKALFNGNPKDRFFILRLERDLRSFISSESVSWRLQPLNSYYRLLVHQIAAYYIMGHILLKDGASMVIFKENTSVVNGNNVPKAESSSPTDVNAKLSRVKLGDIPNDLYPGVELSNDISDDFLMRNGLYQSPQQQAAYRNQARVPRNYNNNGNMRYYGNNNNNNGNSNSSIGNNTSKPFKLIKRRDGSNSDQQTPTTSETDPASIASPNPEVSDTSLEEERLSKEELYNKARQEIFQNGEDDDDDDEDDDDDVEVITSESSASSLPRPKEQYHRKQNYNYYNNYMQPAGYAPQPPPPTGQIYASYGYYAPVPGPGPGPVPAGTTPAVPHPLSANPDNLDEAQLILLQQQQQQQAQYQIIYANGPGVPQPYYYPLPQFTNSRRGGGVGGAGAYYAKRGGYSGQTSRRYYNNNAYNHTAAGNNGEVN